MTLSYHWFVSRGPHVFLSFLPLLAAACAAQPGEPDSPAEAETTSSRSDALAINADPTPMDHDDCRAESDRCVARTGNLLSCGVAYNLCSRWVSCSQRYYQCTSTCRSTWACVGCYSTYLSCTGR